MHIQKHAWRGLRPWERHSLVLVVAGTVYVGIGLSYILAKPLVSREISLQFALAWLPIQGWGNVFIIAGLMAIVSARWPPRSQTWGYTVLTGLSGGWATFYAVGIIFGSAPSSTFSTVLVWSLVSFLWWAISGLVNPSDEVNPAWNPHSSPPSQAS